jgi:hypothetical protein
MSLVCHVHVIFRIWDATRAGEAGKRSADLHKGTRRIHGRAGQQDKGCSGQSFETFAVGAEPIALERIVGVPPRSYGTSQ